MFTCPFRALAKLDGKTSKVANKKKSLDLSPPNFFEAHQSEAAREDSITSRHSGSPTGFGNMTNGV